MVILVWGVYHFLTGPQVHQHNAVSDLIWHKYVPLKVSVFTRHLMCNKLPTRDDLFQRGVISHDAQHCVSGCGKVETKNHLFFHCYIFGSLWYMLCDWLRFSSADLLEITNCFVQFAYLTGGLKVQHSFMHLFWFTCVRVIWIERNYIIFNIWKINHSAFWQSKEVFLLVAEGKSCQHVSLCS